MTKRLSSCALLLGTAALALPLAATAFAPREDGRRDVPAAVAPFSADQVRASSSLETSVLDEINRIRIDPDAYAARLDEGDFHFPNDDLQDAIDFLRAAPPAPPLTFEPSLSGAAMWQAGYLGPAGLMSHTGEGGSTPGGRLRGFGWISTLNAEEIAVNQRTAVGMVTALIIDQGSVGAPHRRDLLNPVFTVGGVGCGPHKTYKNICVVTLSNAPMSNQQWVVYDDPQGAALWQAWNDFAPRERPIRLRSPSYPTSARPMSTAGDGPPTTPQAPAAAATQYGPDDSLMDDRDDHPKQRNDPQPPATPTTQYGPDDSLMDDHDDHPKPR